MRSPRGTLQRAHVLLVAPKLGAVKGPASVLPASVLYGGQEGLKPLSFKMCAFQGEKPLTNRLLDVNDRTLIGRYQRSYGTHFDVVLNWEGN